GSSAALADRTAGTLAQPPVDRIRSLWRRRHLVGLGPVHAPGAVHPGPRRRSLLTAPGPGAVGGRGVQGSAVADSRFGSHRRLAHAPRPLRAAGAVVLRSALARHRTGNSDPGVVTPLSVAPSE